MPHTIRSLAGRTTLTVCLLAAVCVRAQAQQPLGIVDAPDHAQFLSRFDFNVSAAKLAHDDERFSWDTHWAADWDLWDYVYGRMSFLADYQAVLGSEYRPFDPYQSNYLLEASGSYRIGKTEILGVLNHVSRHFGDRFNARAVAENSLGGRVMRRFTFEHTRLDVRADVRKVIAQAYVDYTSISNIDLTIHRSVTPRTAIYGRGLGQTTTVDKALYGRNRQDSGRVEAGIRINGTLGFMELFTGIEKVIDADQLDRESQRWAFAGFRLLGK
jgi:hypothetical protein